jgi:quercetin dioxygenase-like cupin family protein
MVLVVQQGVATFFLGTQQARIVRLGEVVQILAGVARHWVVAGGGRLRAGRCA